MTLLIYNESKKKKVSNSFWAKMPNEYPAYFQCGSYSNRIMEINARRLTFVTKSPTLASFSVKSAAKESNFIIEIMRLDELNRSTAIELLYERMGEYLDSSNYEICNQKIVDFLSRGFSFKLHLALLTLTNKYKELLPARKDLFTNSEKLAFKEYNDKKVVESVLFGLK